MDPDPYSIHQYHGKFLERLYIGLGNAMVSCSALNTKMLSHLSSMATLFLTDEFGGALHYTLLWKEFQNVDHRILHFIGIFIDRDAREIMYLVASVRPSVRPSVRLSVCPSVCPSVCRLPLSRLNCLTYDLDIRYVG